MDESDQSILYRKRKEREDFGMISASDLIDALFTQEPCASPPYPLSPEEEWYCTNPNCEVREVTVHRKFQDGIPKPKKLRCPQCSQRMTFHHYWREVMLERVREKP